MIKEVSKILLLLSLFVLIGHAQTTHKFVCGSDQPKTDRDFREWRESSVRWIMTYAEEEAFDKLRSDKDRRQLIVNFWARRDPDPATNDNEFRAEYCKRLGETVKVQSGIPGWKTDRGRIYVLFGKPDSIANGNANFEGVKSIRFERWFYKNIEGLEDNFQITFIDPTESKEFRFVSEDRERMLKIFDAGKKGLSVSM